MSGKLITAALLFLCLPGASLAESPYDRATLLKLFSHKCERDSLTQNAKAVADLAMARISLTRLCECISTLVVSRMTDADIRYSVQNLKLNQATLDAYLAARNVCVWTVHAE
jgi:hypothetical protein